MIAVNWGSSNLLAYRLDANYALLAEKSSTRGAATVQGGAFREALLDEVGEWIACGESKVLMCGMVGSRYGWKEAPYVPLPAGIAEISERVISLESDELDLRIVPGVRGEDASGVPEVMRGEETEILGCMHLKSDQMVGLPGTHTKWVQLKGGRILAFSTYMTGELFYSIRTATVLGRSIAEDGDEGGFDRGVARANEPGGLLHHLFGVRSMVLAGTLREKEAASYLSGLLIGHELKDAVDPGVPVHFVGNAKLSSLYARARSMSGASSTVEPEGAALRGLVTIARRLSW